MADPANRYEDQLKVVGVTQALADSCDLDELLGIIIAQSMELMEAQRASLFLYDQKHRELYGKIATGGREIRFSIEKGIAGACARELVAVHVPDADDDARFNRDIDVPAGFRTRNILAVPLRDLEGRLVGVLQVLNKRQGGFTADDISLAESLGALSGVALQRAVLLEHFVAKQQMERSLAIARDIQQGLFPKSAPQLAGWDLAGWNRPAEETGGDTYDFFELGQDRLGMLLADATGHGIGPALVIAQTRAMVRALAQHEANIQPLMATVNNLLVADLSNERFVTCFFGVLHGGIGTLKYLSAGQGPMLVYRAASDTFQTSSATGVPLGILPDVEFDHLVTLDLQRGDFFALTTDGFFEATNVQGEEFGIPRVLDHLRAHRHEPAQQMLCNLTAAVDKFCGSKAQGDDLTAIIAKRV